MRDSRIELFRCACMFGVVLLHALTQGGYADAHRGLDNLMTPSVVGFVFISGYFGIKCRLRGVLKLLGIGLSSWIVLAVLNLDFTTSFGVRGYWWFLWMYLTLMTMAPLAETMFAQNGAITRIVPFAVVIFVWSYVATKIPVLKTLVPSVNGFSPFGVLTFFAVYLVARVNRMYEDKIETWWLVVAATVSGAMCWIGFYHYNSPSALVFAGSMFYLFKRLPLSEPRNTQEMKFWVFRVFRGFVVAVSPSMFSVYLLHANAYGLEMLRKVENHLVASGLNYYVMACVVAIGIFGMCVVLDSPRRMIELACRVRLAVSGERERCLRV